MPIRAITLDLDDTLWPVGPTIVRAEETAWRWLADRAPEVAAAWPSLRLREARMAIYGERPDLRHDLLCIRRMALTQAFAEVGREGLGAEALIEEALQVFMAGRNEVELFPEVLGSLQRLARRYRITALTNGNANLERIGLAHLFHTTVAAHSHGTSKPDPRLFHIACAELGCAPEEVVHVGDDVELDVRGARQAGLHAVWVNREEAQWPGDDVPVVVRDLEALERWLEGGEM